MTEPSDTTRSYAHRADRSWPGPRSPARSLLMRSRPSNCPGMEEATGAPSYSRFANPSACGLPVATGASYKAPRVHIDDWRRGGRLAARRIRAADHPGWFDGRSQLMVHHFMFGPDWEEGCKSCSFWADNCNEDEWRPANILCCGGTHRAPGASDNICSR